MSGDKSVAHFAGEMGTTSDTHILLLFPFVIWVILNSLPIDNPTGMGIEILIVELIFKDIGMSFSFDTSNFYHMKVTKLLLKVQPAFSREYLLSRKRSILQIHGYACT